MDDHGISSQFAEAEVGQLLEKLTEIRTIDSIEERTYAMKAIIKNALLNFAQERCTKQQQRCLESVRKTGALNAVIDGVTKVQNVVFEQIPF